MPRWNYHQEVTKSPSRNNSQNCLKNIIQTKILTVRIVRVKWTNSQELMMFYQTLHQKVNTTNPVKYWSVWSLLQLHWVKVILRIKFWKGIHLGWLLSMIQINSLLMDLVPSGMSLLPKIVLAILGRCKSEPSIRPLDQWLTITKLLHSLFSIFLRMVLKY